MNNFKVEIWERGEYKDYTKHAVFPLKIGNFLDEQLDECEVILKRTNKDYIRPMTLVRVALINNPSAKFSQACADTKERDSDISYNYNSNSTITETLSREFVVANDNPIEQPVGSRKYNHQLYLIETTKILEGYIGDSISFTNALGNDYVGKNSSN